MNKPELIRKVICLEEEIIELKRQLEPMHNKAYRQLEKAKSEHSIRWNQERRETIRLQEENNRLRNLDAAQLQMKVNSLRAQAEGVKELTGHLVHLINEGWIDGSIQEVKRFPGCFGREEKIGDRKHF